MVKQTRRNETNNTRVLIRPPRRVALAPRRVRSVTAADPGQPSARSLSIILVPASVYGAVLLGASSRPRVSFGARLSSLIVCFLEKSSLPHHSITSKQPDLPFSMLLSERVNGLRPLPGFL